jgi:hypothetical protein
MFEKITNKSEKYRCITYISILSVLKSRQDDDSFQPNNIFFSLFIS